MKSDDYYPFGLTFNSYKRENSIKQDYLYSGKELQDELNLGWLDYGARMYDPSIGKWSAIDDMADMFDNESPYSIAANNPINVIDVGGHFRISAEFANKYPTLTKMIVWFLPLLQTNETVKNAWMTVTRGTSDDFDEMVTFGSGPTITPTEPGKGTTTVVDPHNGDDNAFSHRYPDQIFLAPSTLDGLEQEMSKVVNGKNNEMGAQMFFVGLKIMHEATHYGVFKYKGEEAFWLLEKSTAPGAGDQGAMWEQYAYKRFSYLDGKDTPMDKGDVFNYYYKNYNEGSMRGMTLHTELYYNYIMLMGPTPDTSDSKKKKSKDPKGQ